MSASPDSAHIQSAGLLSALLPDIEAAVREAIGGMPTRTRRASHTLGLPDGAKAAVAAALRRLYDGPVLLVTSKPTLAQDYLEELRAWLSPRQGDALLLFPPRESLPYERTARESAASRARLRVLAALAPRDARPLVVTDVQALAQRTRAATADANAPAGLSLPRLQVGGRLPLGPFLSALDGGGYRSATVVDEPGVFARRGGIVDVFPATDDAPLRIELLGDEIASLRRFDPTTQRSIATLREIPLGVATEAEAGEDAIALASSLDLEGLRGEAATAFATDLEQIARVSLPSQLGFWTPFIARGLLWDHLPPETLVIWDEPDESRALLDDIVQEDTRVRDDLEAGGRIPARLPLPHVAFSAVSTLADTHSRINFARFASDAHSTLVTRLPFQPVEAYGGRLRTLIEDLRRPRAPRARTVLITQQAPRLVSLFAEHDLAAGVTPDGTSLTVLHGSAPQGWRLQRDQDPLTLLTDAEIFGFAKQRRTVAKRSRKHATFLQDLQPGDLVVHIEHGIGRFVGLTREQVGDRQREYLQLAYAGNDRLLVPTDQLHRLQRYVGASDAPPTLTRLGTQQWARAKQRVRASVRELAESLLKLYAAREILPGVAIPSDGPWHMELEASFPFIETPDQAAAAQAVRADQARPRPMDRIIIGDVGYGKTEIAVRAAFRVATAGQQTAMLVPTTVLAQQHEETFRARLAPFPVRVEVLSRFRSPAAQRAILQDLAAGRIDILIGTHRLLQRDVQFKSLGLVVIDEEQRFGVAHKERLKQLRREVDVLTLSATPIPRTLHMALAGIRDVSTIETPPEERLPIATYVMETDDQTVREAIIRELDRGGQLYFVHNRVRSIETIAGWLRDLVPEARIAVAHGQMPERDLERIMLDFTAGATDILVCTTIIESGLDIPNVNTIIIHQAHRLGLAQLYQLRGRVGRGAAQAYAYLLYDRYAGLTEPAQKRLQAIFEATELGAGFQIAMRDLEIRGAGSLLGAEQSGHIGAVGFELYTQLLAEAVEQLRAAQEGRPPEPLQRPPAVALDLPIAAHIPESYIPDTNLRLAVYQELAAVAQLSAADDLAAALVDRFGPIPRPLATLIAAVRIRTLAANLGATSLAREENTFVLRLAAGIRPPQLPPTALPPGVAVGRTLIRFQPRALGDDWLPALEAALRTLLQLTPDGSTQPAASIPSPAAHL